MKSKVRSLGSYSPFIRPSEEEEEARIKIFCAFSPPLISSAKSAPLFLARSLPPSSLIPAAFACACLMHVRASIFHAPTRKPFTAQLGGA